MADCLIKRNSGSSNSKAKNVTGTGQVFDMGGQVALMIANVDDFAVYCENCNIDSIKIDKVILIGYDTDTYLTNGETLECVRINNLYFLTYKTTENSNELVLSEKSCYRLDPIEGKQGSLSYVSKSNYSSTELGFSKLTYHIDDYGDNNVKVFIRSNSSSDGTIKLIKGILTCSYESK